MRLRLSFRARADLVHIFDYGRKEFGELIASNYLRKIQHILSLIEHQPQMAPLHPELGEAMRLHPVGSHVVVYEIEDQQIVVIRILRGEQNWSEHL